MVIEVKLLQPSKHSCPKLVTDDGMVIEAKLLQYRKHPHSKLVTDDGMVIEVKLLQLEYLQPIITQYFIDNKSEIWLLFLIAHSKR